jgi:hypothetical protein
MKTLLISYGIEDEDIQNITITCDCKNIKNDSIISSVVKQLITNRLSLCKYITLFALYLRNFHP